MNIKSISDVVLFASAALTIKDALVEAVSKKANLGGANLRGADLRDADLGDANLYGANLRGADLYSANLYGANLYGANLRGANLGGADLRDADLGGADLGGADLGGADLGGADLGGAKNTELAIAQIQFIPTEGSFIGWMKCRDGVIVKLGIYASAKRSHGSERKARCSKAKCLEILDSEGNALNQATSMHDSTFVYQRGKVAIPRVAFDEDRWNTCGSGIHFFITREEAAAYTG